MVIRGQSLDDGTTLSRRALLGRAGLGAAALAIASNGALLTPAEARAQALPLQQFTPEQGQALEALGDVLLPGAKDAGIAHFVDDQLGRDIPMLLLKYLDYPASFVDFYRQGLDALDLVSLARTGVPFAQSQAIQQRALVGDMARQNPDGWNGPPAPLFYFVTRSDAVDVYYGTPEGFDELQIPYMPHIMPAERW